MSSESASMPQPTADRDASGFPLLLLCFFLSGLAALLYQTAWMRQFAIVFGTSELAIATVLSAYMAGLASGAWLAGRFQHRVRRPLLAYGILEFLIAAGALLVPWGLTVARSLMVETIGGQPQPPDAGGWMQPAIYVVTTFVILFVPTACMGATLPLLARHAVLRKDQIGSRIGLLYAINTLGAVAGTILAAFVLLPALGLFNTTVCGVVVNILVFMVAAWLGVQNTAKSAASHQRTTDPDEVPLWHRGVGLIMPIMLISGCVSFIYEVLWARLLGHLIGGSLHGFATMLATFLVGITVGSAVASRFARSRTSSLVGLAVAQAGAAVMSMMTYEVIDWLPEWRVATGSSNFVDPIQNALRCSLILLPSTLCIGATFPFAVRAVSDDPNQAAANSARVYSWNTIGGVGGALLAAFLVIPELGFSGAARLAVVTNLALATGTLYLLVPDIARRVGLAVVLITIGLVYQPGPPLHILGSSPFSAAVNLTPPVYLGIGRSSTVRVARMSPQTWSLTNSGLSEAGFASRGAPPAREAHLWLSALPTIARPQAESMLVIGFGSGTVVQTIPDFIKEIDVIELEPLVIEASRRMADRRAYDPLSDPRINIINNDARGALALTDRKYDIIVSQPSHPWTAGASHLYTREFLEMVSDHLQPDGIFLQWMGTYLIDDALFQIVGQTVLDVFPHVRMYQPLGAELMFLASHSEIHPERQLAGIGKPPEEFPELYQRIGLTGTCDLVAALMMNTDALRRAVGDAPVNTDDHNRLAFGTSHHEDTKKNIALDDLLRSHDMLLDPASELRTGSLRLFPPLVVESVTWQHSVERAEAYARTLQDPGDQLTAQGILFMNRGAANEAAARFFAAWEMDHYNSDAGFLICNMARSDL
ncbi:MAG: fused MFS/spermidine synthase, partial [Fuerstiella sp.]